MFRKGATIHSTTVLESVAESGLEVGPVDLPAEYACATSGPWSRTSVKESSVDLRVQACCISRPEFTPSTYLVHH